MYFMPGSMLGVSFTQVIDMASVTKLLITHFYNGLGNRESTVSSRGQHTQRALKHGTEVHNLLQVADFNGRA